MLKKTRNNHDTDYADYSTLGNLSTKKRYFYHICFIRWLIKSNTKQFLRLFLKTTSEDIQ